jgi:small subunit ribosomal protein S8
MKERFPALRNLLGKMDPISNMIISIKNAGNAGRDTLSIPYSKMKESIAVVLKKEGYIEDLKVEEKKGKKNLSIALFIDKQTPKIKGVKRISKTSKRVYKKATDIRPVKSGYGLLILTTPQGIMTGYEAKKAKVGGEALFTIW